MYKIENLKPTIFSLPKSRQPLDFFTELTASFEDDINNRIIKTDPIKIEYSDSDGTQEINHTLLVDMLLDLYGQDRYDTDLIKNVTDLFQQTALRLYKYNHVDHTLINQILVNHKLPFPSAAMLYTAQLDVYPAVKQYIYNKQQPLIQTNNPTQEVDEIIANFGALTLTLDVESKTLVILGDDNMFKELSTKLANELANFPADKVQNASDLVSRLNANVDSIETMFGSIYTDPVLAFINGQITDYPIVPSSLGQIINPTSISLVNLDSLVNEDPDYLKEWANNLKKYHNRLTMNQTTVQQFKSLPSTQQTISSKGAGGAGQKAQAKRKTFIAKPINDIMNPKQIGKWLEKNMAKWESNRMSKNTYTATRRSFATPNRRHQDNFNMPGTVKQTKYRPVIHLYLDTSGSISEPQYRGFVLTLMKMSKSLGASFVFTSFSHYLAPTVEFTNIKTKSVPKLYKEFVNVPKAHGGTDFANVYKLIAKRRMLNRRYNNADEINVIVSDFEYYFPTTPEKITSVEQTLYIPIDASSYTLESTKEFYKQLSSITKKDLFNKFAVK